MENTECCGNRFLKRFIDQQGISDLLLTGKLTEYLNQIDRDAKRAG